MKVLIRKAKIINSPSSHNGERADILCEGGIVKQIANNIEGPYDELIEGRDLVLSAGFMDMRAFSKEPGHEAMETLSSLSEAAAKGGFSELLIMPNTVPVIQEKGTVQFFTAFSRNALVQLWPAAAVTLQTAGESFTEMWDLHQAGVKAFTDGAKPIWNADILLKTLQYLHPKNALLINRPEEKNLALFGQMHEGVMSTQLGMKGIPTEAEELIVIRDLKLLEYAGIKSEVPVLHFSCISSSAALKHIRNAKKNGLPVSCDIAAHQLAFTDEDLVDFDTNLKVSPPFRSSKEIKALQKGLEEGTIDAIVSDHNPFDEEHKNLEFDLAEFGIIGLQTAFSTAWTYSGLRIENLIQKLAERPRELLRMEIPKIEEGAQANLTVVDLKDTFVFDENSNASLSKNSPFFGKELKGKVKATLRNGLVQING
ncbi:dihydroorotase [Marinilongibacter aquaticus]|uniref:dihydroorotase n=1 Tax=Marinilongibacter aquaticus TaxID=2975157 RepID=UPI0021BD9A49|nr:dihydroorotase [Marinilongibacter aquaticus]UBM59819.1 dihydroorotase [Marinilongibacter aquaticus]